MVSLASFINLLAFLRPNKKRFPESFCADSRSP
nr:MAG TPA: hypothetical protein [Bacteriophage sp.]